MEWDAIFQASEENDNGLTRIVLRGVCVDSSVNRNGWQIPDCELDDVARKSIGVQIQLDHSHMVRDVKGKILDAYVDEPHSEMKEEWDAPNAFRHVHFIAEILTDDKDIIIPIKNGYINKVSIGTFSEDVVCSICGKDAKPKRNCECEGAWDVLHNVEVVEYSIVSIPAYKNATFMPFEAGVKMDTDTQITDDTMNASIEEEPKNASVEEEPKNASVEEPIEEKEEEPKEASIEEEAAIEEEEEDMDKFEAMLTAMNKLVEGQAALNARLDVIEKEAKEEEEEEEKVKKEAELNVPAAPASTGLPVPKSAGFQAGVIAGEPEVKGGIEAAVMDVFKGAARLGFFAMK